MISLQEIYNQLMEVINLDKICIFRRQGKFIPVAEYMTAIVFNYQVPTRWNLSLSGNYLAKQC